MPYYEFCLIGGDGSPLCRERHLAADLETVWGRVYRMAESKQGRQIHVLDEEGRIVISIGATAAAVAPQRARVLRDRSDGGSAEGRRMS